MDGAVQVRISAKIRTSVTANECVGCWKLQNQVLAISEVYFIEDSKC